MDLSERDARIVELRGAGMTYVQIGEVVGLSKSRVAQVLRASWDPVDKARRLDAIRVRARAARLRREAEEHAAYEVPGVEKRPVE